METKEDEKKFIPEESLKDGKDKEESIVKKLPDGGYGWFVVFCSFVVNFVLDGIAFAFGVLLLPLIEAFESNRSIISIVGSLQVGIYVLSSPLPGALAKRYGCRMICIIGCILSAVSFALAAVSPNIPMLILSYGIMSGIGIGMMFLPSIVIVSHWFDTKRGLATGIADCGSGIGIILFAPITTEILKHFGWQGTLLTFCGLCLACIPFAACMKVPPEEEKSNKDLSEESIKLESNSSLEVEEVPCETCWQNVKKSLNLEILTNPIFLLIFFSNFAAMLVNQIPYFYLPDMAKLNNIPSDEANYILSIIGITNTIARVVVLKFTDISWVNPIMTFGTSLLICGFPIILAPIITSYSGYVVVALMFGFFSVAFSLLPLIMVDVVGVNNLSIAYGYVRLGGLGLIIGPTLTGFIYDATQSYAIPFYVGGSLFMLGGIVSILTPFLQKPKKLNGMCNEPIC